MSETPPECDEWCFWEFPITDCKPYVPEASLNLYATTYPWSEFLSIEAVGSEDEGVENIAELESKEFTVFNISGQLVRKDCSVMDLKSLSKGFYIIVSGKDRFKISI